MNVLIGLIIVIFIVINSRKNNKRENTQKVITDQPQIKSHKTIKIKRRRPIFKWILIAFGIYLAIGFINGAINPKTEEEKQQELKEKEAQAKKDKAVQESREVALSIEKEEEERDESIAESKRLLEESEYDSIYESERLEESIDESMYEANTFEGVAKHVFKEDLIKAEETEIGGYILSAKIPIGFTTGIMKNRFESEVVSLLEEIKFHDFSDITVIGYAESVDVYGNETETEAIMMILSQSEVKKINFKNFDSDNLSVIADTYYVDPSFK